MNVNLWSSNTPARFWLLEPGENGHPAVSPDDWRQAVARSVDVLELPQLPDTIEPGSYDMDTILLQTLGEGQFGPRRWHLSATRRAYYTLKPFLPRAVTRMLRRLTSRSMQDKSQLGWPIEDRYARFLWEVAKQLLVATGKSSLSFRYFWPHGRAYALVLTHDVETAEGQSYVRAVADLEERLGFRSSFNFVPERYPVDEALLAELRQRGFEVGVHGLKHDGKLFRSHAEWSRRVARINDYLHRFEARGFRTPLTQDHTLTSVLGEETPRLWLQKLEVIRNYHGMALLNSHPDYLREERTRAVYVDFLQTVKDKGGYWHALPAEAAAWWRERGRSSPAPQARREGLGLEPEATSPGTERGEIRLRAGVLVVAPLAGRQVEAERQPAMGPEVPVRS